MDIRRRKTRISDSWIRLMRRQPGSGLIGLSSSSPNMKINPLHTKLPVAWSTRTLTTCPTRPHTPQFIKLKFSLTRLSSFSFPLHHTTPPIYTIFKNFPIYITRSNSSPPLHFHHKRSRIMETTTTELSLGLPGSLPVPGKPQFSSSKSFNKREEPEDSSSRSSTNSSSVSFAGNDSCDAPPPAKAQIVGWPPVRSSRKNIKKPAPSVLYVKVSMDGAPYLRKIDLKLYKSYFELLEALESMFKITIGEYVEREGYNGSDYEPTYEDKDGDWMLVGDVPWEMFISSCKRLRIMKSSEAKGLVCL